MKEIFEGNFGITTYIKNDINLMAQLTYETHPELPEDFIYIGIRTGIGMGIIPVSYTHLDVYKRQSKI